ncbi:MAG TPA: GNAT family N-acetyltransferase [Chloroflexia bacterium]|nr:GNAT family N-acetyltransferase [Chloroflexia bacterium]
MTHSDTGQAATLDQPANNVEWEVRPYREGDLRAIVALINIVNTTYKLNLVTTEEDMRRDFESPRSDPARQVVIVDGPKREGVPGGMILGCGRITYDDVAETRERIYYPRVVVHPSIQGQGLERVIARRLVEIAREYEADPDFPRMEKVWVKAYTREELVPVCELWSEAGMKEVRHFWVMARPLDEPVDEPQLIEGVNIRNYNRPEDNERAKAAFENSFSDHWDHHPITQEDWDYWTNTPNMRPDLSLLAEVEGEPESIVGFCIITIFDEENRLKRVREGWIELLGTTGDWRRKGLGRALLLHGLHSLRSAGMDTALLGVDSQSLTGANRLYESVGFRLRSRELQQECMLDEVKL